jgi:hypothetical protein
MKSQEPKAVSQSGQTDPVLRAMESLGLPLTPESYIQMAYPDQDPQEVMSDPEAMSMLPPELQPED